MLLRRVTKHVKDQNWFAVGIDFVIVVIGVFIGIQVANWNATLNDRAQSRDLIARMTVEALEAQTRLEGYIKDHQVILEQTTRLSMRLQDVQRCEQVDKETKNLVLSVGDFPPPRFSLSIARQALNTDRLALIANSTVQDSVSTISDEMNFINLQWRRYVELKRETELAVGLAAGVALTTPKENLLLSSQEFNPDRYILLTPAKICGNAEIIAVVSNVEITQNIYVGYLLQLQEALAKHVDVLTKSSSGPVAV